MTEHEKRIRGKCEHPYWQTITPYKQTIVEVADLRALLADMDAMRGALEKIAKADSGESGCYYTNRANINIARAALKGASHE